MSDGVFDGEEQASNRSTDRRIWDEMKGKRGRLDEIDQQFRLMREAFGVERMPSLGALFEAVDRQDVRKITLMALGRLPVF